MVHLKKAKKNDAFDITDALDTLSRPDIVALT